MTAVGLHSAALALGTETTALNPKPDIRKLEGTTLYPNNPTLNPETSSPKPQTLNSDP